MNPEELKESEAGIEEEAQGQNPSQPSTPEPSTSTSARSLFVLAQTPTIQHGFARVTRTLLARWRDYFARIDIWGIDYSGAPHSLPYRIWPAALSEKAGEWTRTAYLKGFLERLKSGGYTHLWILQDLFPLSRTPEFSIALRGICDLKKIKSYLYFVVDAPIDPWWVRIVQAVDFPVACARYGADEVEKNLALLEGSHSSGSKRIRVLPHGVDADVFKPLFGGNKAARQNLRDNFCRQIVRDGFRIEENDVLLLNVNTHSRRKGHVQCFQILAELKAQVQGSEFKVQSERPRYKLLMHMRNAADNDGIELETIASQLGLVKGVDWTHTDHLFRLNHPQLPDKELNQIYNLADLYLTTTLGEGWGMGMTEALAVGLAVAAPDHTNCREIKLKLDELGMGGSMFLLPLSKAAVVHTLDNSRLRYPVEAKGAAKIIHEFISQRRKEEQEEPHYSHWFARGKSVRDWLDWDRIASEWLKLFEMEAPPKMIREWKDTPSVLKQTAWRSGYFQLPETPGRIHFNCGVVELSQVQESKVQGSKVQGSKVQGSKVQGLKAYLVTRCTEAIQNGLRIYGLDWKDGNPIVEWSKIHNLYPANRCEHIEDPRCLARPDGGLMVGICHYVNVGFPYQTHQTLLHLNSGFQIVASRHIVYGDNGTNIANNLKSEKNWVYFYGNLSPRSDERSHASLFMIYGISPHRVVQISETGEVLREWTSNRTIDLALWRYGTLRGGTPPVLMGAQSSKFKVQSSDAGEYLSFFHSSLAEGSQWDKRRYFMGAYAFEAQPPWRVTRITTEPLLIGSEKDPMLPWSPKVVFPCGCLDRGDEWFVTMGINDAACTWIRVPKDELLKRMTIL